MIIYVSDVEIHLIDWVNRSSAQCRENLAFVGTPHENPWSAEESPRRGINKRKKKRILNILVTVASMKTWLRVGIVQRG